MVDPQAPGAAEVVDSEMVDVRQGAEEWLGKAMVTEESRTRPAAIHGQVRLTSGRR